MQAFKQLIVISLQIFNYNKTTSGDTNRNNQQVQMLEQLSPQTHASANRKKRTKRSYEHRKSGGASRKHHNRKKVKVAHMPINTIHKANNQVTFGTLLNMQTRGKSLLKKLNELKFKLQRKSERELQKKKTKSRQSKTKLLLREISNLLEQCHKFIAQTNNLLGRRKRIVATHNTIHVNLTNQDEGKWKRLSNPATRIMKELHLFNTRYNTHQLNKLLTSPITNQEIPEVADALMAYGKQVKAITQPVESTDNVNGNWKVEERRKDTASRVVKDIVSNLKNPLTKHEISNLVEWAMLDPHSQFLLHKTVLTCYATKLMELARRVDELQFSKETETPPFTVNKLIIAGQGLAARRALLTAIWNLQLDDSFRQKFKKSQMKRYNSIDWNHMTMADKLPLKPLSMRKLLKLIKEETESL